VTNFETPDDFIASYGPEALVSLNGQQMTLGQALQFEAMFCPADQSRRQDPSKRIAYLAQILASAESLRPEHDYLIPEKG